MSLAALQQALGELFTSAGARTCYARAPETFAARFELSDAERDQLRALCATAVASYAATLARKRRSEAARLLPATRAALGSAFDATFEAWALRAPAPRGRRRQSNDAARFCRYLLGARAALPGEARIAAIFDLAAAYALPVRPWHNRSSQ